MITDELAARYHLPPIKDYPFTDMEYYLAFLCETDYIAAKLSEAAYLHEEVTGDYSEVLDARKYAREKINEINKQEANND